MNVFNVVMTQESIAKEINENPEAGWEAAINPRFSNYTVSLLFLLIEVWISQFLSLVLSWLHNMF